MKWVINVTKLSTPTELTIGVFDSSDDAHDYLREVVTSGRYDREQWIRTQIIRLTSPSAGR